MPGCKDTAESAKVFRVEQRIDRFDVRIDRFEQCLPTFMIFSFFINPWLCFF